MSITISCTDGMLVAASQVCDFYADCYSGEDERECGRLQNVLKKYWRKIHKAPFPSIFHFDGRGDFTRELLDPNNITCPDTHFLCPGDPVYCVPVFTRCNGVKDCVEGQDEVKYTLSDSSLYCFFTIGTHFQDKNEFTLSEF